MKSITRCLSVLSFFSITFAAQGAVLQNGDLLTSGSGSWFALNGAAGTLIQANQTTITPGTEGGIRIGAIQSPGSIDAFFFNTADGNHFTTVAPTGSTEAGIDFSGWSVFWGGVDQTTFRDYRYDAWTPTNCVDFGCDGVTFTNNVATFNWSGTYGDVYELWFSAVYPSCPNCFDANNYILYMTGTVRAVPVPAAVWIFSSGLLMLVAVVKKRSSQNV